MVRMISRNRNRQLLSTSSSLSIYTQTWKKLQLLLQVVLGIYNCCYLLYYDVNYVSTHPTTATATTSFKFYSFYVKAWETCHSNSNNKNTNNITDIAEVACPNGNLCCGNLCLSGVVSDDKKSVIATNATCCFDDRYDDDADDDTENDRTSTTKKMTKTGCGVNYQCSIVPTNHTNQSMCTATIDPIINQIPKYIPRTKLCEFTPAMRHVYAIPMQQQNEEETGGLGQLKNHNPRRRRRRRQPPIGKIPVATYLSTMGPIHDEDMSTSFEQIRRVVVLIHGSRRNVEDYLCCVNAAIPSSESSSSSPLYEDPNSILIIAPWFPTAEDGMINITATPSQRMNNTMSQYDVLRWIGNNNNDDPFSINHIFHTWRYGAGATNYKTISSFDVVDTILQRYLYNTTKFPNLQSIVVTGHSAGGQYVQRWAVLSNSIRDQNIDDSQHNSTRSSNRIVDNKSSVNYDSSDVAGPFPMRNVVVQTVVANPKSYVYFDQRRWMGGSSSATPTTRGINNGTSSWVAVERRTESKPLNEMEFRIPTDIETANCKTYNEWEWGFDHNCSYNGSDNDDDDDELVAPYVQKAIDIVGGISVMIQRYLQQRNVIYLSGEDDIIMNGDCNDHIQGPNRRIRSERYFNALQQDYTSFNITTITIKHERFVIPNVPHNHCLMYQSTQGQLALFGVNRD